MTLSWRAIMPPHSGFATRSKYLAPELIRCHFPHRFEMLPPSIFLAHYVEERTPAGRPVASRQLRFSTLSPPMPH
jgi:hypothetical protein